MIHLHMAERLDDLAGALAEQLATPTADPMAPELIVVPTAGMQRWLSLELSRRLGTSGPDRVDGVAANLQMMFPGRLTRLVLAPTEDLDPWELERVAWVVLEALAELEQAATGEPAVAPLAPGATAWARARRIADLFDRYMTHRPAMIRNWAAEGTDVDGVGVPIDHHSAWQPQLWRLVRERIGCPSPPEALPGRLAALREGGCPREIPERVALFGLSTMPGGAPYLEVLDALAAAREVLVYLHQPSVTMAVRVQHRAVSQRDRAVSQRNGSAPSGVPSRAEDRSAEVVAHPLLRSWGRSAREAMALLADRRFTIDSPTSDTATRGDAMDEDPTVLERVQADLRTDTAPAGDHLPAADDHSVRIHSCHGDTRQVEVLRDQILHHLADDPTLTEEDIVVLCPDLDRFVPIIESVLGPPGGPHAPDPPGTEKRQRRTGEGQRGGVPGLRYHLSDRSLGSTYPLLGALGALVELLASRFSDRAILDFAGLDPVRERFGFDDDALHTLGEWTDSANTRWGLDGNHRQLWGLPGDYTAGTWRAAVDRILTGIAVTHDGGALASGRVAPIAVEGSDAVVAGSLGEMLDRLATLADRAARPKPASQWVELLRDACDHLFAPDPDRPWERQRLIGVFERIADASTVIDTGTATDTATLTDSTERRPSSVELTLGDICQIVGAELGGSPGRPDFFRGGITVSGTTPLRGIPHRVVCLLGMDDSAFVAGTVDGDDLVAAEPHLGDRDRRADARQVLLDSLLAARGHLVVLRNGRDVVTNQPVPAAVPVAEITDTLADTVHHDEREAFLGRLTIVHPRQRFDERNFTAVHSPTQDAALEGPWGFDPSALAGASVRRSTPRPSRFIAEPLTPVTPRAPEVISLEDLRAFLVHPPRYFLERTLEMRVPRSPSSDDRVQSSVTGSSGIEAAATGRNLLVELNGLERWRIRNDLLVHRRAGGTMDSFRQLARAADLLPPGPCGEQALEEAEVIVDELTGVLGDHSTPEVPPDHVPIDVVLAGGVRIVGSVRDDHGPHPGPVRADVSSLKPKHLLTAWLDAMVLAAAVPERRWASVHLCGGTKESPVPTIRSFTAGAPEDHRSDDEAGETSDDLLEPRSALEVVVDLFMRGVHEPLPLFPRLSHRIHIDPAGTRDAWAPHGYKGDRDDEWIRVAFDNPTYESVTTMAARPGDPGSGDRSTRYANHLWDTVVRSAPGAEVQL